MTPLTILIALVLLTLVLLVFYARREAKKHGTATHEELTGICLSVLESTTQKEARKRKVLELLRERGEAGNAEIREYLGLAGRTVVKYMSELEKEGKVEQVGQTGRAVIYRLTKP